MSKDPLLHPISSVNMEPNQNMLIAGNDDECSICLESITNKAFSKDCRHNFCYQCIYNWVQQRPVCPLCLKPIKAIESNLNDIYYLQINEENKKISHSVNSNNQGGENEVSDSESSDDQDDEFEYDYDSETFSDDTDDDIYYDDVDSPDEDHDYFMNIF